VGIIILLATIVTYKYFTNEMKGFIINLDKNPERLKQTLHQCAKSGLSANITIDRFPAINGKTVNLEDWVAPDAINEIYNVEKIKYRTHHYQLTRGGVGCFLSHYNLAQNLIEDPLYDEYLILEDDITIEPHIYNYITQSIKNAPEDWDILLYSWLRLRPSTNPIEDPFFKKVESFWGLQCYVINTKGANNIVDEVETTKIDGQIDSYLSRMSQQKKLNIYAFKTKLAFSDSATTDIQIPLNIHKNIDPFDYRGYAM